MAEPSRPPPPKAYVPSRKPGGPPSRPSTGPAGVQTELPIPPRPAPEDIPPVSPTELTKTKSGRGPPPPPAPYTKRPSATKLSDGAEDEADKGQALPKSRPPAPRPAKAPASRPSKPPASSSKKMDITVVSAQPMTSDVIPPPAKAATPTTDPPMPTEPPPEPPTEVKIPPPKPNRSPPVSKAILDKESEPLPKRGPAPPKPVRGSPPLPLRGGQDDQGSSSPKDITERRPSRGSPHVRKAPPPPAGRTRPPPPQSKAPPVPSTEAPSEYTALIPTPANSTTPEVEYMIPQAPTPASEYTEPVSSKTLSKSSADSIEPVSGAKSDKRLVPTHKAPPPPVSRPSALPTSRSRPPPTSRPPPPPTQGKEETREEVESPTHLYAEVSPSTSQTSLGEAMPSSKDTPPPVPSSPRPSAQPKLTDSKTSPSPPKKSPPTKPPSSRPRPPPPQVKKEEVTEDKATPTAAPTARPRPPLPRTISKDEGVKATPTPRSKPPPPVATPQETNETPPTSRSRPPPPKAAPPIPEKSKEENKTPPTSHPRPLPPKTKSDDDHDQDAEKTPPPSRPPPKPAPRQDSGSEVKAQPPMKPKPRPKKIPSVSSVEETETTPTNVETAMPTQPIQDEVKKEATPPVVATRPPPKKPPVVPKRSISKTDAGSEEPLPSDTPTVRETSPPPAKPRPPPQAKPRPPPPKSKEEDKTEEPPPPRSSATPSNAPPTRPTSGPTKAPPPSRPGQGPKPKPARPPGTAPPKPTPPVPSTRSKPPNKDGPPVPTARRGTASKEDSDAPPPLPPRPEPGHPLYRYVCSNPHGIAKTNKEAPEADELSYYEGDVIELIEKIDDHWYYACNADNDMQEGLILAKEMKIIKRLPGQDKVMEDGPCAVAMTAFEGRSSDELSFKEGTLIMLISRVGGDEWLRGRTLKGEEGIFPKSFVEVVEDLPLDAIEELQPASPEYDIPDGPYCIATETFVGENPDDLSFDVGDLIEITERIDDSWLRGMTNGRSGMFPQVFVDVKVDTPIGIVGGGEEEEKKNENVVKALFDYDGEEGDLSFKEGDMITLLSKVSDEWIYGQLDGREGMFPSGFISHIPESLPMKTTKEEPKIDEATPTPEPPKTPTGECEALFDYVSDNLGDLSFKAGEKITLTEWINDEWCNGTIGDRAGMFPLSFVKITKDLPKDSGSVSKAAAPKSQKKVKSEELSDLMPKAKAIRNFEPASSLEMRVQTGDMIILLSHEAKNMYMGENVTTGEFGNFPANCVEVIVPLP